MRSPTGRRATTPAFQATRAETSERQKQNACDTSPKAALKIPDFEGLYGSIGKLPEALRRCQFARVRGFERAIKKSLLPPGDFMVHSSMKNLQHDRRLQGRRGWESPESFEKHLEELPDVEDKGQLAGDPAEAPAPPSASPEPPAPAPGVGLPPSDH